MLTLSPLSRHEDTGAVTALVTWVYKFCNHCHAISMSVVCCHVTIIPVLWLPSCHESTCAVTAVMSRVYPCPDCGHVTSIRVLTAVVSQVYVCWLLSCHEYTCADCCHDTRVPVLWSVSWHKYTYGLTAVISRIQPIPHVSLIVTNDTQMWIARYCN